MAPRSGSGRATPAGAAPPPPRAWPARAARRCRRAGLRSGSARTGKGPRTRQTGRGAGAGASTYALRTSRPVTSGGWELKHGHPKTQRAMADHYAVLGVSPDANRSAIQAAYRDLARRHHPDFGGDGSRMAALNEAWSVLGRDETRMAYDATRRVDATARGAWQHAAAVADRTDLRRRSPPGRRPARAHARVRALCRLDGQRARGARPGLPRVARSGAGGADVPQGDLHGARATAGCCFRPDGHGDAAGTVPIEVRPPPALVGRSRFRRGRRSSVPPANPRAASGTVVRASPRASRSTPSA